MNGIAKAQEIGQSTIRPTAEAVEIGPLGDPRFGSIPSLVRYSVSPETDPAVLGKHCSSAQL
jgi:hypothetical protein